MIFLCSLVEFSIIYAHPPSYDGLLWDKLVIIVFNYCHSSLLRYYLYGVDSLAVWNKVDYAHAQELQDLFLHYFPHRIIEPSLRLP